MPLFQRKKLQARVYHDNGIPEYAIPWLLKGEQKLHDSVDRADSTDIMKQKNVRATKCPELDKTVFKRSRKVRLVN